MCQLNLYIVPKSVDKDFVFSVMEKHFNGEKHECFEWNEVFENKFSDCNVYASSCMRCNCNTVQTYYSSEREALPWDKLKQKYISNELNRSLEMKKALDSPDFFEEFDTFNKKIDKISNRQKKLGSKAQKQASLELQELVNKHQALFNLTMHYNRQILNKDKEGVTTKIDQEFLEFKQEFGKETEKEYRVLSSFISDLLEKSNEVSLLSFWQDASPYVSVLGEKTVSLKNLTIEDIIYLNYHEVLTIKKV